MEKMRLEVLHMKAYLANGLFGMGDRLMNDEIARRLRDTFPEMELYVPQENIALNDKNGYADSMQIAQGDDSYLLSSDFLIAVLDGVEIDSGVACEIGKFSMLGRPIFGLFTDIRQHGRSNEKKLDALVSDGLENQFVYRNLYVIGQIKLSNGGAILSSLDDLALAVQNHQIITKKETL